ncbi:MAG: VWA domain-containing protein [Bacteriovoracaceae bacterium]|nr:VWA domain-containing protein [Bacteriovoracaceae bacterium]
MSFLNLEYLPIVIIVIAIFWFLTVRVEKKYYQWIKVHWFYKQSLVGRVASVLYFIGFSLLLMGLLDLRGPETRVMGKSADQKTVVLIDASASMLSEDVRPNRFKKATLLAKHFIKKAVGHQISVVVFSDGQKRIVPFTKDVDLVEARLNTLEGLDLDRGGTGLSMALQESIQYFVNSEQRPFGNVLIITDAEETDGGLKLDVPEGISVAVVGVGTAKGAPIPIRNNRGVFKGNKKYKGETVISKLDEQYLKQLGEEIKHFKYWVASSYSLPTEDILSFFNRTFKTKQSEDDFRIRPVLANYLLVPGMIFLVFAFLLKNARSFTLMSLLLCSMNLFGQEKKEPVKNETIIELENKFAQNKLNEQGQKKLASELLKQGFAKEASNLYEEVLPDSVTPNSLTEMFNLGAAQFKAQNIKEGMNTYTELLEYLDNNPSSENKAMANKVKLNMLKAIQAQTSQQKKKEKQNKNKQNKDGKKKENDQNGGQSKDKGESGESKDNKEQDKGQDDKDSKDDQGNKDQDQEEKENEKYSAGKKNKEKMPSILKQLLSDDNQLQKKVIDADTVKGKSREKKDW